MNRVIGVIPVRLESTRLPRKALRLICGHSMIEWVYRRARGWHGFARLVVATDSEEVVTHCGGLGIPATLTSSAHRSGSDRVIEVMTREPAELYVNIQGDEPMVTARHIELLMAPFQSQKGTAVSTLKVAITREEVANPNDVKVVTDCNGRALYFSRSPIPYDRAGAGGVQYYKHLGLYAYTREALAAFSMLAPSELESAEALEQLRFLENGIQIDVVETADDTVGVDTEDDLRKVEECFQRENITLPGP
ncbi:MAG: 3-deoxy-manno-octulosonate cytidylyltransferase [Acidobacteria bacterium]|nr:MAG: 3-deoxy-manno-octulosonate cytidylyltransferase [Acidobacteriota bacterium]